jgi:surface antigen
MVKKNPNAVALGRLGGAVKVPKGFATMSDEDRKRIQSAGGKASKRGPAKKKKATK